MAKSFAKAVTEREKSLAYSFRTKGLWRCKEKVEERGTTWFASVETGRLRSVEEAVQGLCGVYTRRRSVTQRSTIKERSSPYACSLLCAQRG